MPRVEARPFSLRLKRRPKFQYHRRTEVSTRANRRAGTRGLARAVPGVRLIAFGQASSVQPQLSDVPRIWAQLITFHALDDVRQHGIGAAREADFLALAHLEKADMDGKLRMSERGDSGLVHRSN